MESSTRLPTVWPTRALSQPGMTCSGEAPMTKPNGEPCRPGGGAGGEGLLGPPDVADVLGDDESPLATVGPSPLISVFVTSPLGGGEEGKVRVGALPAFALTVGRVPPPLDTWVPDADAVSEYALSKSTTNTSVVVPVMPSLGVSRGAETLRGRDHGEDAAADLLANQRRLQPGQRRARNQCGAGAKGTRLLRGASSIPGVDDVVRGQGVGLGQGRAGALDERRDREACCPALAFGILTFGS